MEGGLTEKKGEKAPDLARLKAMFEEARDLTSDARTQAMVDIDYYDSKQWTPDERRVLQKRKQPDNVFNRIKPAVNGILGVVQRGKSEPRAWPRTPQDEDSSDVATDTLRYIGEFNRFDALKLDVFKDILVPGTGAVVVEVDSDKQVKLTQARWEEFFYDPRARRPDFKDARYMGIAKWMYADDVSAMFPDKREDIDRTVSAGSMGAPDESFADRPQGVSWVDRRGRRMLVVDVYHRDGGNWMRTVYHCGDVLSHGPSPYLNAKGEPDCPIEAQSAFVDRDNNRYGAVRDMRGPQDEINKRRSKALHHLSTRQLKQTAPGEVNIDAARREAARPDGVLPHNFDVVQTADMTSGHLTLLQEAKAEIERMGPNPAILGREGQGSSGRALLARQQSGLIELAILFGGLEDWELRVYRQMWARARQFWTDPMWIRVTDDEGAPKFVQLNEPQMGQPQVVADDTGRSMIQPTVLGYKNAVAEMDVDIIIDATPDTANVQAEAFQDIVQLVGSNPIYAQQVPFELLLSLSPIPHKKSLRDQIKAAKEEAMRAQAAAQQQQAAMVGAKVQSETEKTAAETRKIEAEGMYTAVKATNEMRAGSLPVVMPAAGAQPGAAVA